MLKGFTKFEKIWVFIFSFSILSTTIYFSATMTDYGNPESIILNWIISPVSAITGIFCVVLCAKGRISTFLWGTVNCATYGYIAWRGGVYGDMIINVFYFLPFQLFGFLAWKNKMQGKTVKSEFLKRPITSLIVGIITWIAFAKLLTSVDHWITGAMKKSSAFYGYIEHVTHIKGLGALLDASTEVGQFFGQLLLTFHKAEQWLLWIGVNIISMFMWVCILLADKKTLPWALPTLIMWVAYFANSIYGWREWKKRAVND